MRKSSVYHFIKKKLSGSIVGSQGGSITSSEGVILELAPNSIVKDNSPYTGQVNAVIKFINPESEHFQEEMPGNLVAVKDNQSKILTSYGMVAVELTDNSGAHLQIAPEKQAKVRFPIPASLQNSAPTTIDLWSFDEANGYWNQEGSTVKLGTEYLATMNHFSWWTFGSSFYDVRLDGQILNAGNQYPLSEALVTITSQTHGILGGEIINSSGFFGGHIPANETLFINVSILCSGIYNSVYTASIGPFSSNATLAPINISLPISTTTITGSIVDCNGNTLTNGYVFANGQSCFTNNGFFSFTTCGTTLSVQAMTSSPWVVGQSQSITLNGSNQNIGNLQVCGSAPNNFSDIDGNSYSYIQIGSQTCSQTNLNVTKYRNGDPIPHIADSVAWSNLTTGTWCWYNNDSINYWQYGKLYNWYAVNDPRGLAPQGWHVSKMSEVKKIIKFINPIIDTTLEHFEVASAMKSAFGWRSVFLNGGGLLNPNGTNNIGFSGLPAGSRFYNNDFQGNGDYGGWWSSNEYLIGSGESYTMKSMDHYLSIIQYSKKIGLSVRVVKD